MKNLASLALAATVKNSTTRKVKNVNERILDVLGDGTKSLTREELVVEITNLRVTEDKPFEDKLPTIKEATNMFDAEHKDFNEAFIAHYIACHKTVKNGVDTSISHSQNNSSFHYNKKYEANTLSCNEDGKYSINTVK
jgi:hypothetical protein